MKELRAFILWLRDVKGIDLPRQWDHGINEILAEYKDYRNG